MRLGFPADDVKTKLAALDSPCRSMFLFFLNIFGVPEKHLIGSQIYDTGSFFVRKHLVENQIYDPGSIFVDVRIKTVHGDGGGVSFASWPFNPKGGMAIICFLVKGPAVYFDFLSYRSTTTTTTTK